MIDRLCEAIIEKQNPTVMGLDPLLSYIPESLKAEAAAGCDDPFEAAARALFLFNKGLIDACAPEVAAVKPQVAYYELYSWQGMRAYQETIDYAKRKGLYVIADVKRNDIGSTASAYAKAYLGETELGSCKKPAFDADAATVSPYLGSDGIRPFLECCEEYKRMIFLLVKTSNPSSGELQDKVTDGKKVYELMAEATTAYGESYHSQYGYSNCGAVVGATYPEQLAELRKKAPHTFFLVPGYGAQGAGAAEVAGAFDARGLGAVINSSRGIMCAWQKEGCDEREFAEAALREVRRMKAALLEVVGGKIG